MCKALDVKSGSVQLQGIGRRQAKPAGEIKVGDILVWNFGYTSEVLDVEFSKSGKTLTATLKSSNDYVSDRKFGVDRLVAYQN